MSITAYQKSTELHESPVEREIRAFSRVISKLETADRHNPLKLIPAIHENERLWTVLQSELAAPDNALPPQLRANLLALSIWSLRHGVAVIAGKADIQPIIDVNKDIVAGLLTQRRSAAAASTPSGMSKTPANAA